MQRCGSGEAGSGGLGEKALLPGLPLPGVERMAILPMVVALSIQSWRPSA